MAKGTQEMSEFSYTGRAKADKRKVRRHKSPNTDRMYAIYDPAKRLYLYYKTGRERNRMLKKYLKSGYVSELACKLSPKKR